MGKYYIVDIGLRNYLLGFREGDSGHILKNIIFFELMRRGYDVAIGKIDNQEVDFIATKTDEKKYIQVTKTMNAPETRRDQNHPGIGFSFGGLKHPIPHAKKRQSRPGPCPFISSLDCRSAVL